MKVFDRFVDARPAGDTLGSFSTSGAVRRGIDRERRIAIDHGALRFQPLVRDGWNRQGLSYGPIAVTSAGVAFSVGLLNGHNASQAGHLEQPVAARLRTWLAGGGTHRMRERLVRFVRSGRYGVSAWQFLRWLARAPRFYREGAIDENLAVGFFAGEAPQAPHEADVGFVMHAAGPENGDLWARVFKRNLPVLRGAQDVPLLLAIVKREQTATYYVASSEAARNVPRMPLMRPVAVTPHRGKNDEFPGVHQSALGQAGFRVDTRVYGVRIEPWDVRRALEFLLEDSLTARHGDRAIAELPWQSLSGAFERSERGICGSEEGSLAWLVLPEPAGLIHVLVVEGDESAPALLFGDCDVASAYAVQVGRGKVSLSERATGRVMAEEACDRLGSGEAHSLQVVHEESGLSVCLDGRRIFDGQVCLSSLRGVGLFAERRSEGHLRNLEVHPRCVPIPNELEVPLPSVAPGSRSIIDDQFEGPAGDLDGREVTRGVRWRKELGAARIVLDGDGRERW